MLTFLAFASVARTRTVGITFGPLTGWIIIGLLAGWLSGKITRGHGFGCLVDIILGLIGAVVGGWIFSRLGIEAYGFLGGLAAATVGAVILLAIARLFA